MSRREWLGVGRNYGSLFLFLALFFTGCAAPRNSGPMVGFNVLQHKDVSWQEPKAKTSLLEAREIGANSVMFVPFMHQLSASATTLDYSDAVTDEQLVAGMRQARKVGLRVVVKPQILVDGSWAGAIDPQSDDGWRLWFASYSEKLLHYARIAKEQQATAFVVGTELAHSANRQEWSELIRQVRSVFHGQLTFAAHEVEGVKEFAYWDQLDAISVTLYPSLGNGKDYVYMKQTVGSLLDELQKVASQHQKPIWIAEYGIPSASGAADRPWDWQLLQSSGVKADLAMQESALAAWISAISERPWITGSFIWAWYSNPMAGGEADVDYTPQNKPARQVISQLWKEASRYEQKLALN